MIERFQGSENRQQLIEALKAQTVIRDDDELAVALADHLSLAELGPGEAIVTQGAASDDLYFILAGRASIVINGREVAIRRAGEHIGEMALVDPTSARSGTVLTLEQTVVGKVTEPDVTSVAERFPRLWRLIAVQLCNRLRQQNNLIA